MSKVITSTVKRFPGTITLPDYLNFPQAVAWEKAQKQASQTQEADGLTLAELLAAWQPGIRAVVEAWNLENYNPDNPPATPRASVIALNAWIIDAVTELYREAEEVPNE